ncbi:prolipoprotein diacylglyceryl transferase [Vagococcus fluvialis]|uniref:prolipoprotein diacylglyceryl transferase n=1 Tax=Vagococcus fluvialis TaxID=2738 RepID=UPI001432A61A|nr:prolipoprotein diacylglyceryl transferase [Vagococcus fluvialis]MBO0487085.1 prolipoprotein diacylglyceryl transferase [Vagococcus fluvialis]NKC58771.1 prolipoprotein diacylglyceryl transferase [Vagococcus fluvialis]NKD49525.1 prolipoprotein diacylglyceryl transferase [Vagococcus fluvialis]WNF91471.1 prolipoprotein diacylglyceryl transferase [Vagococcus fluvialis]
MLLSVNPIAFNLFGIDIMWYAIIIVSAIVLVSWLASKEAVKVGLREDDVVDLMLWALPISIVGARLYYVLFELDYYIENPGQILAIRSGGLAIYGGLIAGGLVVYFFTRHRFISTWKFLDVAAPSVILAQGIGRWGNFMNHEAYGEVVSRNFLESLHLPKFIIENMYIDGEYRQPTFLYESVWSVLGFVVLILLRRKLNFLKEGEVALVYVIWYSLGRFFIEGMRTDSLWIGDVIRVSQMLSGLLFVGAIGLLIYRRKKMDLPFYDRTKGDKKA